MLSPITGCKMWSNWWKPSLCGPFVQTQNCVRVGHVRDPLSVINTFKFPGFVEGLSPSHLCNCIYLHANVKIKANVLFGCLIFLSVLYFILGKGSLLPGSHSLFVSLKRPCLQLPPSLQVLAVIRASFLFSSGLTGQYDCCQAPEQRWKPITGGGIVYHTNTFLSACVFVFLPSLSLWIPGYLNGFMDLWIYTFFLVLVLRSLMHRQMHHMSLTVSCLWRLWLIIRSHLG